MEACNQAVNLRIKRAISSLRPEGTAEDSATTFLSNTHLPVSFCSQLPFVTADDDQLFVSTPSSSSTHRSAVIPTHRPLISSASLTPVLGISWKLHAGGMPATSQGSQGALATRDPWIASKKTHAPRRACHQRLPTRTRLRPHPFGTRFSADLARTS